MLKTLCNGCIFKEEEGCQFNKELIFEEKLQLTPGFCKDKRMAKWAKSVENPKDKVREENSKISAIYIFDGDFTRLDSFLSFVSENDVDEVVVSTQGMAADDFADLIKTMQSKSFKWGVDNIVDIQTIAPEMKANYASRLLKNHWFFIVTEDNGFSSDEIRFLRYKLTDCPKHNFAGFYITKDNYVNIIVNRHAFVETGGNSEKPWLQKIQDAENSEYVCPQL